MTFPSDFPGIEDASLPAPRNQRLPSFLETNVWGQEDEAASSSPIETKAKVDSISKRTEVLPTILKEEFNQQSSFPDKPTSPTYWEDPTSAWGSEPAFKPPSPSLENIPNNFPLAQDITPDVPSEVLNTITIPLEEVPDTFGDFSSFNNGFEEFNPDESQEADFGGFGDFATDAPCASKPFEAKPELEIASIPRETQDIIHCFNVDVDQEINTILENLCGFPSEPLELDYSLDSILPKVFKEIPMSPEAQALKRSLFSPTQVDSKFSWQGSNTEATFFCINGVSDKAQRRYKIGTLAVEIGKHPFDFRPKKVKSLPTSQSSPKSDNFITTELLSKNTKRKSPGPQEGVLLTDFSEAVQSILCAMPYLSFMDVDQSDNLTSKSLFGMETESVPVSEFSQFIGETTSQPKQPVFDLLD